MSDTKSTKPVVFLSNQDGNVFAILGACSKAARREGWTPTQIKTFKDEAMSGDYDNVLRTALKYFTVE